MSKDFFTMNDDFSGIIAAAIPDSDFSGARQISSGWTNIVFNVPARDAEYIFRFPRNLFWTQTIEKDVAFANFIAPYVSIKTPRAKLMRDKFGRPFSAHEKLPGNCLTEVMAAFSREQTENAINGIAEYLAELAAVPIHSLPEICKQKESDFLADLAKVYEKYHGFDNALLDRPQDVVAHGDLNPGNILTNADGTIAGIIDYAFAGLSHAIFDLSNIISRCPDDWKKPLADAYKKSTEKNIDEKLLDEFINCRRQVEVGYIKYMKAEMPEIILPDGF
ncbi:MAG: aminoglycoside phosphotransferase family protein [Rickettsiales bacterium]|jgi:aminoglycoside phosphotransferase (APT) family kinase protein|nr:aminoglycoside phosphotransferase family protein [Rickettsiales bacterium]